MSYEIWIEKADENFASAQLCFEQGYFNACANRMYYAMFHAGIAAFAKAGLLPAGGRIGHDWLQANLSREFIHLRKTLAAKFRSYLSDAQALREIADYQRFSVSKSSAARELKKAKDFVNTMDQEVSHEAQA